MMSHHIEAGHRACRVDPELFFGPTDSPQGGPMLAWELRALQLCHRCPVVQECLQAALEFPAAEQHGVIGGATAGQRRQLLRLSGRHPSRSYRVGLAGRVADPHSLGREVDEVAVARLMAGDRPAGVRQAERAQAALELARAGHSPTAIAARLGEHDRQIYRWLADQHPAQPASPGHGAGVGRARGGAA